MGNQELDGVWIGVDSTWYLSAFIPKAGGFKLVMSGDPKPNGKTQEAEKVTVGLQATAAILKGLGVPDVTIPALHQSFDIA